MQTLYMARFLCAGWTLIGFFGIFICWGIEKQEDIDMSSFRSNEVILFVICLGLVWLLLHTIIRKYDKGEPPVKKTKKEKLTDLCIYYFLILTVVVPIISSKPFSPDLFPNFVFAEPFPRLITS